MHALSYTWSFPVTRHRWWSHQSICHSQKHHATCRPPYLYLRSGLHPALSSLTIYSPMHKPDITKG